MECLPETVSYARLYGAAGALARRMCEVGAPGDRVAILCRHGLDYVIAFLACLYADRVAVPLPPVSGARSTERLDGALADARPTVSVVSADDTATLEAIGAAAGVVLSPLPGEHIDPPPTASAVYSPAPYGPTDPPVTTASALLADPADPPVTTASALLGEPADPPVTTASALLGDPADPPVTIVSAFLGDPPTAGVPTSGEYIATPTTTGLAYLQYTSGSTKTPAGVRITHANLTAALTQLRDALPVVRNRPIVTWLPFFHDMGLVLGLALPLYCGVHGVTLAPQDFAKRPIRWLRACTDYRAGLTGSPNFGLSLTVSGTSAAEREGLDLSGLATVLNGAEPIRADALTEFTRTFAPYGFHHRAHTPGYGLAEATLAVTIAGQDDEPIAHRFDRTALGEGRAETDSDGITLVACGTPAGQRIAVVDPLDGTELAPGAVGEIWVSGPNVGAGYHENPMATGETFGAGADGTWLRTGDLGFRYEGHLYIAGRGKDLIVVDGRNHYPADIESTAAAATPHIRSGHLTAFGHDDGDREHLVIVAEVHDADDTPEATARRIRTAVATTHEVMPDAVILVEPGRIPKTSSGKVRRGACRALYGSGLLPVLAAVGRRAPTPD